MTTHLILRKAAPYAIICSLCFSTTACRNTKTNAIVRDLNVPRNGPMGTGNPDATIVGHRDQYGNFLIDDIKYKDPSKDPFLRKNMKPLGPDVARRYKAAKTTP